MLNLLQNMVNLLHNMIDLLHNMIVFTSMRMPACMSPKLNLAVEISIYFY